MPTQANPTRLGHHIALSEMLYSAIDIVTGLTKGLLRGTFPHTNTGPKANKMPYVFTNPPRDTELFTCDKVFVLSPDVISTILLFVVYFC